MIFKSIGKNQIIKKLILNFKRCLLQVVNIIEKVQPVYYNVATTITLLQIVKKSYELVEKQSEEIALT